MYGSRGKFEVLKKFRAKTKGKYQKWMIVSIELKTKVAKNSTKRREL